LAKLLQRTALAAATKKEQLAQVEEEIKADAEDAPFLWQPIAQSESAALGRAQDLLSGISERLALADRQAPQLLLDAGNPYRDEQPAATGVVMREILGELARVPGIGLPASPVAFELARTHHQAADPRATN
jgi:hypothetical protein